MKTRSSKQRGWLEKRKRQSGKDVYLIRWYEPDPTSRTGWKKRSKILKDCGGEDEAKKELVKKKPSLTVEQIHAILREVPDQWNALFLCCILTGLRLGELLALRWCAVNLLSQTLTVEFSLWRGQFVAPKTEDSQRTLHIPDLLLEALLAHRQKSSFTTPGDLVFCRADGSPCDPDHLRREVLYPVMERAGIERSPRSHGFHLFRHTAGSLIHRETNSIKLAQQQLGHSKLSTTADIYVHPDAAEAKKAAEALARAISCPPLCPPHGPEGGKVH